jgi:hypothetical protein
LVTIAIVIAGTLMVTTVYAAFTIIRIMTPAGTTTSYTHHMLMVSNKTIMTSFYNRICMISNSSFEK